MLIPPVDIYRVLPWTRQFLPQGDSSSEGKKETATDPGGTCIPVEKGHTTNAKTQAVKEESQSKETGGRRVTCQRGPGQRPGKNHTVTFSSIPGRSKDMKDKDAWTHMQPCGNSSGRMVGISLQN